MQSACARGLRRQQDTWAWSPGTWEACAWISPGRWSRKAGPFPALGSAQGALLLHLVLVFWDISVQRKGNEEKQQRRKKKITNCQSPMAVEGQVRCTDRWTQMTGKAIPAARGTHWGLGMALGMGKRGLTGKPCEGPECLPGTGTTRASLAQGCPPRSREVATTASCHVAQSGHRRHTKAPVGKRAGKRPCLQQPGNLPARAFGSPRGSAVTRPRAQQEAGPQAPRWPSPQKPRLSTATAFFPAHGTSFSSLKRKKVFLK